MEECLKLLKGSSDEQRLAGLYLATKLVSGDDSSSVRQVFDAIGFHFINRLLKTGMGQLPASDPEQNYLPLAISILAAFCRVPDLAASEEIIDKVPVFVALLGSEQESSVRTDLCECLLAIGASEKGLKAVFESGVFHSISHILEHSHSGAPEIPAAVTLLQSLAIKINLSEKNATDLGALVPPLARHLSTQQSLVKFAVLDVLRILLIPISPSLPSARNASWPDNIRSGLGQILHSRVAPEHRTAALELTEQMVEIQGSSWLLGNVSLPNATVAASADRFLTLVVESLRVEVPIVLGETIRGTREASPRILATYYALLEHIISFISDEDASQKASSQTLVNVVSAVDEIIGTVLEGLEDARDKNSREGDELLSSVRLVGRFLAEVPNAHKSRVLKLLGFMLSITTADDTSSHYSVQLLIPALLQITLYEEGCEALVSSQGHKQIISYIVHTLTMRADDLIIQALDILINVLQKRKILIRELSYLDFVPAIPPLLIWAVKVNQRMESALVTCFCVSVLAMSDEEPMKSLVDLQLLSALLQSCLHQAQDESSEEKDLIDMIISDFEDCVARYPSLQHLSSYLPG